MIFALKIRDLKKKKELRTLLHQIKKKTRYTYPDIVLMALRSYKAGLK